MSCFSSEKKIKKEFKKKINSDKMTVDHAYNELTETV